MHLKVRKNFALCTLRWMESCLSLSYNLLTPPKKSIYQTTKLNWHNLQRCICQFSFIHFGARAIGGVYGHAINCGFMVTPMQNVLTAFSLGPEDNALRPMHPNFWTMASLWAPMTVTWPVACLKSNQRSVGQQWICYQWSQSVARICAKPRNGNWLSKAAVVGLGVISLAKLLHAAPWRPTSCTDKTPAGRPLGRSEKKNCISLEVYIFDLFHFIAAACGRCGDLNILLQAIVGGPQCNSELSKPT